MLRQIHGWLGAAAAVMFLALFVLGAASWLRNRDPGAGFYRILAAGQVLLAAGLVLGAIFFAGGSRRPWLHYAYGIFPVLILVVIHRSSRLKGLEWAAFAISGLVIFGLLLRAYMTGSGG